MRPEMIFTPALRIAVAALVAAGGFAVATTASAQQRVSNPTDARAPGMRYLTWPGKVERPRAALPVPSSPADRPEPASRGPIMSMPAEPMAVAPITSRYSARTSPGPTPASAWVANGGAPTYRAPAAYAAAPAFVAAPVAMPEPPRAFAPAPMPEPPPPTYAPPPLAEPAYPAPDSTRRPVAADTGPASPPVYDAPPYDAPVPAPALAPAPAPAMTMERPVAAPAAVVAPLSETPASPAYDPMAPRPDAPIFRLLGRNAAPAAMPAPPPEEEEEETPTEEAEEDDERSDGLPEQMSVEMPSPSAYAEPDRSPRRYSVHRGNVAASGGQPLSDPLMLGSDSVDLAEPPATPTVMRNIDGRIQAIAPNQDPTLP